MQSGLPLAGVVVQQAHLVSVELGAMALLPLQTAVGVEVQQEQVLPLAPLPVVQAVRVRAAAEAEQPQAVMQPQAKEAVAAVILP